MTVVVLSALETLLEAPGPVSRGAVVVDYWAGTGPYIGVDGDEITFPESITVTIVDGAPTEPIDLVPTGDVCCVRWVIRSYNGGDNPVTRFTSIPDVESVDFGDLPVVDPDTFAPVDPTPTLIGLIDARVQMLTDPPSLQEVLAAGPTAVNAALGIRDTGRHTSHLSTGLSFYTLDNIKYGDLDFDEARLRFWPDPGTKQIDLQFPTGDDLTGIRVVHVPDEDGTLATREWVTTNLPALLEAFAGYNSGATQMLVHVNGVPQWVTV